MAELTQADLGGAGRYIVFNQPALDDIGPQTHVAYVKPANSGGGGFGYLYGKTPSASANGPRFYLGAGGGNGLAFAAHSSNAGFPNGTAAGPISYGEWQHLSATWDGSISASGIAIYINGIESTTLRQNGSGTVASDATNDVFLMNRSGLGREYVGDLAYYAIWSRVLSSVELEFVRTDGPLEVPAGMVLLYANGEDLGPNALSVSSRSVYVAGELPTNTHLGGDADITAPTLTSPSASATGATTASGSVSTNEASGTLYYLASANASESAATVKAGSSQAVSATGSQPVSLTGLTASTSYYLHFVHRDAAGNDSAVASSAQFTTDAEVVAVKGASIALYNGSMPQASITGIRALWWDATAPDATPDYYTASASTDASGVLTLDLDAATGLDVGDYGYLLLHKDGTVGNLYRDALEFAGAVQITDIS